jgi:hypothetical protein
VVFKTIGENIKSFFQKEEQLEHRPKKVPDAAIEVFEKPAPPGAHHIVAHNLRPPATEQPRAASPRLPFSSEQLRERLSQQTSAQQPQPRPRKPLLREDDIAAQIVEFEHAIRSIPGEDGSSLPVSTASASAPPVSVPPSEPRAHAASPQRELFFSEFARFLQDRGYSVDDSLLTEEALARMKAHHEQRLAAERHRENGRGIEEALAHKLSELQGLERDWADKQEEILTARERMADLEEAIVKHTGELKGLVSTMKEHTAQAPPQTRALPESIVSTMPLEPEPVPASVQTTPAVAAPMPHSSLIVPPISPLAVASARSHQRSTAPPENSTPVAHTSVIASGIPSTLFFAASPETPASAKHLQAKLPSAPLPETLQVNPEKRFYLQDGRVLSSLAELHDALLSMEEKVYHHHVTPQRNDFATWIRDVFKEDALAAKAAHCRSRYELARLLAEQQKVRH